MIVDGKQIASGLREKIIQRFEGKTKKEICFVIFGNDLASRQFIGMKCRFAESIGIPTKVVESPDTLSVEEISNVISEIADSDVGGIVIQLPLPKGVPVDEILNMVPPLLDIDILSEKAKEQYRNKVSDKIPPVSRAVKEILSFHNISLENKKILVAGTGRLVGEPVCNMLKSEGFNFDVIDKNTDTEKSANLFANADIVISGVGSSHMIKPDMIKDGVVLIDAGTSEQSGKIVGDVDPLCVDKASFITPVPGGVGPVTLASLFLNIPIK